MPSKEEIICYKFWKKNDKPITPRDCSLITGKTHGNSLNQLNGSYKSGMLTRKIKKFGKYEKTSFIPSIYLITVMEKKENVKKRK